LEIYVTIQADFDTISKGTQHFFAIVYVKLDVQCYRPVVELVQDHCMAVKLFLGLTVESDYFARHVRVWERAIPPQQGSSFSEDISGALCEHKLAVGRVSGPYSCP